MSGPEERDAALARINEAARSARAAMATVDAVISAMVRDVFAALARARKAEVEVDRLLDDLDAASGRVAERDVQIHALEMLVAMRDHELAALKPPRSQEG